MMTQTITFADRQRFIRTMVAATSLVTFQAYLVAPLGPKLVHTLGASKLLLIFAIPSFAIPFGLSSFAFSLFANRFNREKAVKWLLIAASLLLAILSESNSGWFFLLIRAFIGFCSAGIVQFLISIITDFFPRREQGLLFDWLILALAAGMTFGPTAGACLFPLIDWRWQFVLTSVWALLIIFFNAQNSLFLPKYRFRQLNLKGIFRRCSMLIKSQKGKKIYSFVFLNGIFHSGLFVWISYYFSSRFHFADQGTGLALLLFSLPGLLMAVIIGLIIKRSGNVRMLIWGMTTVSISLIILLANLSFWLTMTVVGVLSIGYVMTLPFYAGMINRIRNRNPLRITLGLGFGLLFLGYGTGPVIFISMLYYGYKPALAVLILLEVLLFLLVRPGHKKTKNSAGSIINRYDILG